MPARKATSSGKWSQSIWDVTPSVGDDVFANNFTIEIDQNVNVGSLRTTLSTGYAVAGGGFTLYQPLSVIASPRGFLAGTTTCLTSFVSAGTATLSGGVYNTGAATSTSGILHNSNGNLTLFGSVTGARAAGSAANAHAVNNGAAGLIYIIGEVHGGNQNAGGGATYGVFNASLGTIVVNGNVVGGGTAGSASNHAIFQNSTGTVLVIGTITASANAHGVVSANDEARNEFTGTLVNSISGRQAVYCAKYLVHPKMFDSATVQAVDRTGTYISYFAPEAYSSTFVPHTSSVALGTAYAAVSSLSGVAVNIPVQLSGTMVVPSAGSVSLGTLVGNTSGTAILNSQDLQNVWNTNINTLTTDGTIFKRLANSATVSDVGTVLQNINL
jgi:hypothetical protein